MNKKPLYFLNTIGIACSKGCNYLKGYLSSNRAVTNEPSH